MCEINIKGEIRNGEVQKEKIGKENGGKDKKAGKTGKDAQDRAEKIQGIIGQRAGYGGRRSFEYSQKHT
jgi:hypothetical protein